MVASPTSPPDKSRLTGFLGMGAGIIFALALLVIGGVHPTFRFIDGYVSELGANDSPTSLAWNLIGFGVVGLLLAGFGVFYGHMIRDRIAGILLGLFGLGFALTSIPIDAEDMSSPVSKAHTVAICLALGSWLFGLAKISSNKSLPALLRKRANVTAGLLVSAILGGAIELWSMPLTHKLVFTVVFGWTIVTSVGLLRSRASQVE